MVSLETKRCVMLKYPPLGEIEMTLVNPQHELWEIYLNAYMEYLAAQWPSALEATEYPADGDVAVREEDLLIKRFDPERRVLLLWRQGAEVMGFANAYIDQFRGTESLFVAELSVTERFRRRGLGRWFLGFVKDWARRKGIRRLIAEVDPRLPSNGFWACVGGTTLIESRPRNIYQGQIDPLRIVWVRHAATKKPSHPDYCPREEELGITEAAGCEVRDNAAAFLAGEMPRVLFCSSYRRAMETASEMAAGAKNLIIEPHPNLREFFPEALFGRPMAEIIVMLGANANERFLKEPSRIEIPNSETLAQAQHRISTEIMSIASSWSATGSRLILSHEVVHALWVLHLLSADMNAAYGIRLAEQHSSQFSWNPIRRSFDIDFLNRPLEAGL